MPFQYNISSLLGRIKTSRHVEFTGVEVIGDAKLATPVEKATTGPIEKVVVGCSGGGAVEREVGGSVQWRGRCSGEKTSGMRDRELAALR
jgi:hypothetical protein